MKNFGEKEAWAYPGTAQFFGYPLLSQEWEKLRISNWPVYSEGQSEQKSIKNLEKSERGRIQGLPNFFGYPLSGTGKATKFKFCMHIYRLNRNKCPLKISGKVAVGVYSQGLPKILRAPIDRAHRAVVFAIAQLSCRPTRTLNERLESDISVLSNLDSYNRQPLCFVFTTFFFLRVRCSFARQQQQLCAAADRGTAVVSTAFYRAMHYSAKRGLAIAYRLSVRLSVPTHSLFVAKTASTYSQGNMGKF